jgi:hypothetical protein
MQSIAALILVVILALPLCVRIWNSWSDLFRRDGDDRERRHDRDRSREDDFVYDIRNSEIIRHNPWVISELINIDAQVQNMVHMMTAMRAELSEVKAIATAARDKSELVIRMMRRKPPKAETKR